MSRFTSKILDLFYSGPSRASMPHRVTPTSNEMAAGDESAKIHQADSQDVTGETKPEKLSARERLDKLSSFRIQPTAIRATATGPHKRGGKAEVGQATFRRKIWSQKKRVAVKKLGYHQGIKRHRFCNEFTHEVELMATLSHENIVQLIGFVEDFEDGQAWIVMSWEPNGNVSEFLATGNWEIPERISLIQDTFEGLQYLHTRQPPIRHGDLKAVNILVSSSFRAIITDFGSARAIGAETPRDTGERAEGNSTLEEDHPKIQVVATSNQLTLTGPAWSVRWAAPEVMNGDQWGLPSDIWSAGWVCWEVMTDTLPFPDVNSDTAVTVRVVQGQLPSAIEDERLSQIARLCILMTDCWAMDPKDRPSASHCCAEVKWVPSLPPLGGGPSNYKVGASKLFLQMGHMHYQLDRHEMAASYFQQVIELSTSEQDRKQCAEASYWLGNIAAGRCKYIEAKKHYVQADNTYRSIGDNLGHANALRELGCVYHHQSKLAEAKDSLASARAIYDGLGDHQGQASTLCSLGHIFRAQSNTYDEAAEYFVKAQEIYACIGDDKGRAEALLGLGSVYHAQSKFVEAEELFSQAHSIYGRIGDFVALVNASGRLGDVNCIKFHYTEADCLQALEVGTRIGNILGHSRLGNFLGEASAWYGLGEIYRRQSKHTEAGSCYARGGEMYLEKSKYTEAESSYKHAQHAYAQAGEMLSEASALYSLGEAYRHQSKHREACSSYTKAGEILLNNSKYTEAEALYKNAIDICTRISDCVDEAKAWYGLGEAYRHQSKYTEASSSYARAGEINHGFGEAYRLQYKRIEAKFSYTPGGAFKFSRSKYSRTRVSFHYTSAKLSYKHARDMHAHIGDARGEAKALYGLAEVYRRQSKHTEAESAYKQARDISIRIGDAAVEAGALYGLGDIYHRQFKYTDAESCYKHARDIYARVGDGLSEAKALHGLGAVYRHQYEHTKAELCYKHARDISVEIGDASGEAKALYRLGAVYCHRSTHTEAESSYKHARDIYARIGDCVGEAKAWYSLGEVYRHQSKQTQAASFYTRAIARQCPGYTEVNCFPEIYQGTVS